MSAPFDGHAFITLARRVRAELAQRHRYVHTLRVARLAAQLARLHGEDPGKALIAGMLHDLARLYSDAALLEACTARGMPVSAFEREHPIVLHARLGAELARERFAIADEAILSAIRKHTVGDARMSRLDTIVYLADGLEPGRPQATRAAHEALARRDLRAALAEVVRESLRYLSGRGLPVAPETLAALESLESPPPAREMHTAGTA